MEEPQTLYVLTRTRSDTWGMPPLPIHGAFTMPDVYPDGIPYPGLTGLAFGKGNPQHTSFEHGGDWFVIRVAASDATFVDEDLPDYSWSGVRFRRGFVVYRGDRRGALEMLIMRGADPGEMQVRLALPGEQGVALSGKWDVAVGGTGGYAQSGDDGISTAEDYGVARSGARGKATIAGQYGIAVVGSAGEATTEYGGISVIQGDRGRACAGLDGIAIALGDADDLKVGTNGIAIAKRRVDWVEAGDNAVVVVGAAESPDGPLVQVGKGSLVVSRLPGDEGCSPRFAVAVAGRRGFKANTAYLLRSGFYRKQAELLVKARRTWSTPVAWEFDEEWRSDFLPPRPPAPGGPWWVAAQAASPDAWITELELSPRSIVVLQWLPDEEPVRRKLWEEGDTTAEPISDRNPASGLEWGCGDVTALESGEAWSLVVVDHAVRVQTPGGGYVRFESGERIYCGELPGAVAALEAFGIDPATMAVTSAQVGDGQVARVGRGGFASAGFDGWAIAGDRAVAGPLGYAETTHGGKAWAGDGGIAVASEGGEAVTGGIAVSFSSYSRLNGGHLAVATEDYVTVASGNIAIGGIGNVAGYGAGAIAIGASHVVTSRNGVAIARYTTGVVCGEEGALLVVRSDIDPADWLFGVVGENGIEPNVYYRAQGGSLVRCTSSETAP